MTAAEREMAITVNGGALMRIVMGLFAMLPGEEVATVTRFVHLAILAILRPAEAATRRLIAIASVGVIVKPARPKAVPTKAIPKGDGERMPVFGLFDSRLNVDPKDKRVPGRGPGVWDFGEGAYRAPPVCNSSPNDPVNAAQLIRRMKALRAALGNLSRQGRRLARALAGKRSRYPRPMRPGRPPGHRTGGTREIDVLLADCQTLALMALHPPDT